jgi:hypothetical protein
VGSAADEVRDPFADDVLERLLRSNQDYQHTHGNYIVPLSARLLASRALVRELGKSVETWTAFGEGMEARMRELESALERIDALTRLTADTRAGNAVRELGDIARTALAAGGRSPVGADGEQEA